MSHVPAVIRLLGYNPLPEAENSAGKLIRHRTSHSITQKEFAKKLRIDPATLPVAVGTIQGYAGRRVHG